MTRGPRGCSSAYFGLTLCGSGVKKRVHGMPGWLGVAIRAEAVSVSRALRYANPIPAEQVLPIG